MPRFQHPFPRVALLHEFALFDPGSGLFVHPVTVGMMIIWFFACFTPIVPHVANAAHGVGLVMGVAWGYLSSLRHR